MTSTSADIVLWELFRRGDRDAFGKIFRMHYSYLYQFGIRIADDVPMLEDCIQELFVEIWQSKLPPPSTSVKAYLLKALKYKLLRHLRNKRLKPVLRSSDDYDFELSHENLIISAEVNAEQSQRIRNAVGKLTNRQKEIIYLKYYQGLEYDEISAIMDINYQAARNLLSQSIGSLKKIFAAESMFIMLVTIIISISRTSVIH